MEDRAPLVSVVIATYRPGDYLRQALASVLAQTCGDFEVLVADDARDEETRVIAASFGDARIVYHANPVTLGAAGNHWAALRRARSRYAAILNHDDLWQPDFLRRTLAGFETDPRVVVSFCDHDVIGPAGEPLAADTEGLSRRTGRAELAPGVHCPFADWAGRCVVPAAQAAVFARSALDLPALPTEAGPAYDLWLNYLLARDGGGAFYVPERLASWRTHPASLSMASTRSEWPAGAGECFVRMAEHPLFAADRRALRRRAADCFAGAALAALRGGRGAEARRLARRAVRQDLVHLRAWGALGLAWSPPGLRRHLLKA